MHMAEGSFGGMSSPCLNVSIACDFARAHLYFGTSRRHYVRLSPAAFSKFHPLKEYSVSFTVHSKRLFPLYHLVLQQRPLNSILYRNNITHSYFIRNFSLTRPCTAPTSALHASVPAQKGAGAMDSGRSYNLQV
jgi:hypothetical protein